MELTILLLLNFRCKLILSFTKNDSCASINSIDHVIANKHGCCLFFRIHSLIQALITRIVNWINEKWFHLCRMKFLLFTILINIIGFQISAQPLIHAHNDYQKPEPLTNALRHKVFSIEADIYCSGDRLLVAHDKKELPIAPTLDSLYLQPIIELFRRHRGFISNDSAYAPMLMIDIKENGEIAIAQLIKLVSAHRSVFDRSLNGNAVQLVISGDRGASSTWSAYPRYILFDGRPNEVYDSVTLQRVAFISDSYLKYINPQDSSNRLIRQVAKKVHSIGKLFRLWGSPDNPDSWKLQQQQGIDIINTDKVEECRDNFLKKASAGN